MKYAIVMASIDTEENAKNIANLLLEKKLAACIQLFPITSYYIWQGKKETAKEILMLIKTQKKYYSRIENLIRNNHPYEIPEILLIPVDKAFPLYGKWIDNTLKGKNV
ncbi:divalent-cation tolerance protein CutA [Thermospira aquatica]|uniref:Divalent-cation tolerance protein CutA n=1 Tax=Thermospira aquatica TaxID=2828656 RepID=A0AAX3BCW7_9SPIR|nr:divalent-cation tolerance protein CutA [Thermospira aquatica]URA10133.1 divalent-cation tolerance protein CutA [Thermospira aquatica]